MSLNELMNYQWLPLELSAIILALLIFIIAFTYLFARIAGKAFEKFLNRLPIKHQYPKYDNYIMPLRQDLQFYLFEMEREFNFKLSADAQILLLTPLIEYYSTSGKDYLDRLENEIWKQSVKLIMSTIAEYPYPGQDTNRRFERQRTYNTMAVVYAFQARWCNIPPFCKAT